jgi:predicted NAD-dependent protein-ADP-ribosyltransferase YbiA (DUF1768 family)
MGQQKQIKVEVDKIAQEYKVVKREYDAAKANIADVMFMKNIQSLEQLKGLMRTCEFWGDSWAINTLERILNIKFILLSSNNYLEGDIDNVMQCGDFVDPVIENRGEFHPEFYIIVDHTGNHYKLVEYKHKSIFKFKEIPYDLKHMIVHKCMERQGGIFSLIPQFAEFKDAQLKETNQRTPSPLVSIDDELGEAKIRNLYDDGIEFRFYINSANKKPGKGAGETIRPADISQFTVLASISDWRRRLSDSWIQSFVIDNHKWASVEHYYQASKYKKQNPEFYLMFSLDSDTDLSKNVEMAMAAGGKTGKYQKQLIRPKTVEIDADFYANRADRERISALTAKFSQNDDLRHILLETKNAKLVHHKRANPPEVADALMVVRSQIQ